MTPAMKHTADEICRRGEEIYERHIRPNVESQHKGEFLVIDIESGDYMIDADDAEATERLLSRKPNAVVYGLRIGYPAAYRIGSVLRES
jgi:hypothetical protein